MGLWPSWVPGPSYRTEECDRHGVQTHPTCCPSGLRSRPVASRVGGPDRLQHRGAGRDGLDRRRGRFFRTWSGAYVLPRLAVLLVGTVWENAGHLSRCGPDGILWRHASNLDGQFDRGVVPIKADQLVR